METHRRWSKEKETNDDQPRAYFVAILRNKTKKKIGKNWASRNGKFTGKFTYVPIFMDVYGYIGKNRVRRVKSTTAITR